MSTGPEHEWTKRGVIIGVVSTFIALCAIYWTAFAQMLDWRIADYKDNMGRKLETANAQITVKETQLITAKRSLSDCQSKNLQQVQALNDATATATEYQRQLLNAETRLQQAQENERRIRIEAQRELQEERRRNDVVSREARRESERRIASAQEITQAAIKERDELREALRLSNAANAEYRAAAQKNGAGRTALLTAARLEEEALERKTNFLGFREYVYSKSERRTKIGSAVANYRLAEDYGLLPTGFSDKRRVELEARE